MTQFSAPTTLCGSPHRLARLSLCLALAACANEGLESASATTNNGTTTEDATSDTSGDAPCLADEARAILATHCATCHRPDGIGAKAFADPEDLEALVGRGLVIAGAPDDSPLYTLLVNGAMPPAGSPRPDASAQDALRQWIADGAASSCDPSTNTNCPDPAFLDVNWIAERIQLDLLSIEDPDVLPFTRYLTLVHHHNRGLCGEQLDNYRYSLAKLVNSLSRNPTVTPPWPVDDSQQLIYRLDLRDYNWEKITSAEHEDAWELIAANNPFALEWDSPDFDVIRSLMAKDLEDPTSPTTRFPFQPYDSFNETAIRNPEIYHTLVGVPDTFAELEAQLAVNCDIDDDDNQNPLWAGMLKGQSNVSEFNRVIERCEFETNDGRAYWRSYDFGRDKEDGDEDGVADNNCKNILDEPVEFCADGGEIIYSLPNGLQAYMIVNAAGARVDEAPANIVQDPTVAGEVVRNPFSCIGCHNDGIKPKADSVFPIVDEHNIPTEYAQVKDLYDHPSLMAQFQVSDKAIYSDALLEAGVPDDLVVEPIQSLILEFEAPLDAYRVAAELQIPHELLMGKLELIAAVVSPSYKALTVEGGKISRPEFENDFATLSCLFSYGTVTFPQVCLSP